MLSIRIKLDLMGPLRNKMILENPIVDPTAIVDSQLVFFDVCNASGHEYSVCPPQLDILLSKVLFICMSRRLMKVDIISKPKFLSHRSSVIISCVNVDIAAHQNTHWRQTKVETTGATQDYETLISRLSRLF